MNKRMTSLLVMLVAVLLATPVFAQQNEQNVSKHNSFATFTTFNNQAIKTYQKETVKQKTGDVRTVTGVVNSTPAPKKAVRKAPAEGMVLVTLSAGDVWGDGSGYQMLLDADATAYGTIIPESGALTSSGDASDDIYAEFEYKIPTNADGALATSNIVLNNSVTIEIPAGVYDFCITNPTPDDRLWIASENGSVGGRQDDFQFVAGGTYEFVVSMGGSNDQVDLNAVIPGMPTIPTDVAVDVNATTAVVAWEPGENNDSWNLRYRPYVDPANLNRKWTLPLETYSEETADWTIFDADDDGNNWGLAYSDDSQNDVCFYSESWNNSSGALTPDNWLITPEVTLGGTLKFKAWNLNSNYPDVIGVFITTSPDYQIPDDFVQLGEDITPSTDPQEYEFDLSAYEGTGYIAIRHYNSSDMYRVYVDDIEVTVPNAKELQEWVVVEDAANPYTINDLLPETTYEVQVQGVNDDLDIATDWTESTMFSTPAVVAVAVGNLGLSTFCCTSAVDFTGVDAIEAYWATVTADGKITFNRIYKVPANTGLLLRNATGAEEAVAAINIAKLSDDDESLEDVTGNALVGANEEIASLPTDGGLYTNYILNKVNGNVGFFRANNQKVPAGRAYLQVPASLARSSFSISFDGGATTAIKSVEASQQQGQVYDLQGRRVAQPLKGLYIVDGKKMVIR